MDNIKEENKLTIESLKDAVDKLHVILKDPQPGMITWWECCERISEIIQYHPDFKTIQIETEKLKRRLRTDHDAYHSAVQDFTRRDLEQEKRIKDLERELRQIKQVLSPI